MERRSTWLIPEATAHLRTACPAGFAARACEATATSMPGARQVGGVIHVDHGGGAGRRGGGGGGIQILNGWMG
eukprot:351133-Chlamydomonas_euryale.AAC.13